MYRFGHRQVLVKGYVHRVEIICGAEVIARHARSYERESHAPGEAQVDFGEAMVVIAGRECKEHFMAFDLRARDRSLRSAALPAGEVYSVSELPPALSALGAIGASVVRLEMREKFPTEQYGNRSLIASVFSPLEREFSCRAPGRTIQTHSRQALLLGLAFNLYSSNDKCANCRLSQPRGSPQMTVPILIQNRAQFRPYG
jgi:hypothetical protein